jgi:hypothetical protein
VHEAPEKETLKNFACALQTTDVTFLKLPLFAALVFKDIAQWTKPRIFLGKKRKDGEAFSNPTSLSFLDSVKCELDSLWECWHVRVQQEYLFIENYLGLNEVLRKIPGRVSLPIYSLRLFQERLRGASPPIVMWNSRCVHA